MMAQIREIIELLTRVLYENGTSKVKAEVFRQAKFNKREATESFWKLLFELVYFCMYGNIDDITFETSRKLTKDELVVFVKREIQQRGFHSKKFATLPTDMSHGSRELLLAFGWLFCREGILDRFMDQCSSPIEEGTAELYQTRKSLSDGCLIAPSSMSIPNSPAAKVQQLLLLNGKLRLNLRSLFALQTNNYRTLHQVHSLTKGVRLSPSRDHLSSVELQLFKHPDVLERVLHLLEKDNIRLHNLLRWQSQEEGFWKWMETVLDLKIKDLTEIDVELSPHCVYNIQPDGVAQMLEARKNLQQTILMYESMVEELEELWDTKKSSISEEELDNLISSLDMEISLQKARILLHCPENVVKQHKRTDLSYVTSVRNKTSNIKWRGREPERAPVNKSEDILCKISSLEDHLLGLEKQLETEQGAGRAKLESMTSDLQELIFIPPLGHREYV